MPCSYTCDNTNTCWGAFNRCTLLVLWLKLHCAFVCFFVFCFGFFSCFLKKPTKGLLSQASAKVSNSSMFSAAGVST